MIALLLFIGLAVGVLGTLIGAGGGFLLMPILLMMYPADSPEQLTSISMAAVFLNALSGSIAYLRMGRIDLKAAAVFSVAAMPGAIVGTHMTRLVARGEFDRILGVSLMAISLFIFWKALPRRVPAGRVRPVERSRARILFLGALVSAAVGFVANMLGIGGGVVHVPALIYGLGFPVHTATATSQLVLLSTSASAVIEHLMSGVYLGMLDRVLPLGFGAVIGGQLGAKLSHRVQGKGIVIALAVALSLAGLRLVWRAG